MAGNDEELFYSSFPRKWNPVKHAGECRFPRPVILVPPSRYFRDSGNDELGDTGIQYNMPANADSLFTFLDSRYDEKYGRWRSLFFYRSGMTHF